MTIVALVLVAIVAFEHLYFLYLEMFAWTAERTRKAFGTTLEFAEASKTLAANQGLYNGFLAAGLLLSLILRGDGPLLARLFLCFVIAAALYGGATVNRRILVVQGVPAALAMIAVLVAY
jgi:putative membrane protein